MAAHFTNNALVVWFAYENTRFGNIKLESIEQLPIGFVLGTLVLGSGILVLYQMITEKNFKPPLSQPLIIE